MDGIKQLPHPPYILDLVPSTITYLGQQFRDVEDVKNGVPAFIDSKPKDSFRQGLDKLAKRLTSCCVIIICFLLKNDHFLTQLNIK